MSTPEKISSTVTVAARVVISCALCSYPAIYPFVKASSISSSKALRPLTLRMCSSAFYQQQLGRYPEALRYLQQRGLRGPALIQEMRIGYAPGGSLRRHLTAQGYSFNLLQHLGLLNSQGHDAFYRRIIFPCCQDGHVVNLYGRSIAATFAHRFLPGSKGGLYAWEQVRHCPDVILVEGLFDHAVL
jgi:DNA primase